jgi:Zn-dependent peptidase ImmA (M78 family)
MDLEHRREHIDGMLKMIALDLDTAQTKRKQASKSKGGEDAAGTTEEANAFAAALLMPRTTLLSMTPRLGDVTQLV